MSLQKQRAYLIAALAVVTGLLSGCEPSRPPPASDKSQPQAGAVDSPGEKTIRVAMSAAFVSESGVGVYEKITNYLETKAGIRVEFITGLAYSTINDMLSTGAIDCGFVCGLPYVILHDRPAPVAHLLVAPIMKASRYKGQPKYYSDLIVRKDSLYKSIHDLRGRTYVYNDELSNSGYNLPRYRLVQLGLTDGFFGKVLRSGSHEESIRMVAAGQADASFVDSLVLDYDREKKLGHAHEVRVLESVGPAGICPLVVSSKVKQELRDKLQHEFATMHNDPIGREILDDALLDRFAIVGDRNYDDIRAMRAAAEKANFTVIK